MATCVGALDPHASGPPVNVARSAQGGQQYLALRSAAQARGRPFDELLTLYALEGLLGRLSASPHASKFVLKGGLLLAALDERRPTRDADLLAQEMSNEAQEIEVLIAQVAGSSRSDGLVFDPTSARSEIIRDDEAYSGVRIHLTFSLATARIHVSVDVNVGDPVFPDPQAVTLDALLPDSPPVVLQGYRMVSVLAEKAVTGMQRGVANTRWRDWADMWTLTGKHSFDADELAKACAIVSEHRMAQLSPLSDLTRAGYPTLARQKWSQWRRKQDHNPALPDDFSLVLKAVSEFIDPALDGHAAGHTWDPHTRLWVTAN